MRLLLVTAHLEVGGPQRQLSILLPALRERGFEPSVLTTDAEGPFFEAVRAAGIPARCVWMSGRSDLRGVGRALAHAARARPDVILSHGVLQHALGEAMATMLRVAHVAAAHRAPGFRLARHQELLLRAVTPSIDRVVAVCSAQTPDLVGLGYRPERVQVIPSGVDETAFQPARTRDAVRAELGVGDSDFVALMVAVLRPEKRPEGFARAVLRARRSDRHIVGVVAGSGPELPKIETLAAESHGGLRLLGHREDVADLVAAADAVCLTSAYEALPMAILEGMALGRPVVAPSVGAIADAVLHEETGLLVPQHDDEAVAEALLALASDRERAESLGRAGRERQRRLFTARRRFDRYAQALREARDERGRGGPSRRRGVGRILHRALLRTARGPLEPLWAIAYTGLVRVAAGYLRRGNRDVAAYVAGSIGSAEALYGLSDVDLVVVMPDDPERRGASHLRLKRRWDRIARRVPLLGDVLMPHVAFYEDEELREAVRAPVGTYGLDGDGRPDAHFFGTDVPFDDFALRSRPGVGDVMGNWRLVVGPDRRPRPPARERQDRRAAAWYELQFLWSFAFQACRDPDRPWAARLCTKLVSEPIRIWLALFEGAADADRERTLRAGLRALPEEEGAIRMALDLDRRLARSPRAPLRETMPAAVRLTARLGERLTAEAEAEGTTEVRLRGTGAELALPAAAPSGSALLPLCDWRAVVVPSLPDEALAPSPAEPGDPEAVATAAEAQIPARYPALTAGDLVLLPALGVWTSAYLRAVQCRATDPVSFALLEGDDTARFPAVAGWSAEHWARRAVAEHGAWIRDRRDRFDPTPREWLDGAGDAAPLELRAMAKLLTAARAALFLESLEDGEPELTVTVAATARRLAEVVGTDAPEDAHAAYRDARAGGPRPPEAALAGLREAVAGLRSYSRAAALR